MATKHSHGPNFGRRVDDCLRYQELAEGAAPVRWARDKARNDAEMFDRARREHFAPNGPHAIGACGPVCTFGDW